MTVLSLVPVLLPAAGVDWGVPLPPPLGASGGNGLMPAFADALNRAVLRHEMLEWTAVGVAVAVAAMALAHLRATGEPAAAVLVLVMLVCAGADLVQARVAEHLSDGSAAGRMADLAARAALVERAWLAGRVATGLVLAVGAVWIARRAGRPVTRPRWSGVALLAGIGVGIVAAGHAVATAPLVFPVAPDGRLWGALPLVLMGVAGVLLWRHAWPRRAAPLGAALGLSIVPHMAAQAHMAFGSAAVFDHHFMAAHVLKALAYVIPFGGMLVGHVAAFRGLSAEVAARQTVLDRLEVAEGRHAALIAGMADAVLLLDREERVVGLNPAGERLFRCAAGAVTGRPAASLLGDPLPRPDTCSIRPSAGGDVRDGRETTARRPDGSTFAAELAVLPDVVGGAEVFAVLVRDVSERNAAATELRQSRNALEAAQRIARLGHWHWDIANGNALSWSDEVYRIFGLEPQQFGATYQAFLERVHPLDRELVIGRVNQALAGERDYEVQHRVLRPDGTERVVVERGEVFRDHAGGEPVAMLGTVHDVTERVRLEESLERARAALEQRVVELEGSRAEIQGFYHTLSHELKTPLTAAREFALILRDGLVAPVHPQQADCLGEIVASCDQMNVIINDLLDSTRLDTGKLSITPRPVPMERLVRGALAQVRRRAEEAGITIAADVPGGLPDALADEARVAQVLGNLLNNALRFTPAGGSITVGARLAGEVLSVWVRDTGCGMEPDMARHAFDRFHQGKRGDGSAHSGLGLGLYISRELVRLHGGEIAVESVVGEGSTFTFTLPLAGPRPAG